MELQINTEKFRYTKRVYEGKLTADETMEMIVPDALPDIGKIIDTKAYCYLKGKDSDSGSLLISAAASGSVVFLPDGQTTPIKVEFNIPLTFTAADEAITPDCKIIASLCVRSAEAALINPRKLSVRVTAFAQTVCYNQMELTLAGGIEDNGIKTQFLKKMFNVKTACDVSEKLYVISDEIRLSSGRPPIDEILYADVKVLHEDIKCVGSKVILNGILQTSAVYTSPETAGVNTVHSETRFSQIIEMSIPCEGCMFNITSSVTGIYMNADLIAASSERSVNIEVHVVSQCEAISEGSFEAVCDAYSPIYSLDVKSDNLYIKSFCESETISDSTKASIEAIDVSEIVSAYALVNSVNTKSNGENLDLCSSGMVCVMYLTESGELKAARTLFSITTQTALPYGSVGYINEIPIVNVSATMGQGSIDTKISVSFTAQTVEIITVPLIMEVSYDEECVQDSSKYPSVVIRKPSSGDTIWLLSKTYHSTVESVMTLNKCENQSELLNRKFILIPREK